ncbi:MAG: methionine--tRNA ligase, partial [Stappiaceae bacterium]
HRAFDGYIPSGGEPAAEERALTCEVEETFTTLTTAHENLQFRQAAALTRALWVRTNRYLQEQEPWALVRTDFERAEVVTRTAVNLVSLCASVSWCIIPILATEVLIKLSEDADCPAWPTVPVATSLNANKGKKISKIPPLVAKFSPGEIQVLAQRFSGK